MNCKSRVARQAIYQVMGDLVHLGYGNFVHWRRVVGIFPARGTQGLKLQTQARQLGLLLNVSGGHRIETAILTDTDHVFLAAVNVADLWERIDEARRNWR